MLFLYRSNAELCAHMARAAKSEEIRQQWMELAKLWQDKADAEEQHLDPAEIASSAQDTTERGLRAAAVEDQSLNKPEPELDPIVAPALPELASSPIAPENEPRSPVSDSSLTGNFLDDQWTRLIEEIRAK